MIFSKSPPWGSKTWKKDLSGTKSNKSAIWMLERWHWIPRLVYPLGRMGFSFSTLAFKLWICLILFRTCLPQIPIFGGIAKCNNSVSFSDRSTNFSPNSLKNYFLNFEKYIFWNLFWLSIWTSMQNLDSAQFSISSRRSVPCLWPTYI